MEKKDDKKYQLYQQILLEPNDSIKCARLIYYGNRITDSLNDYNLSLFIFEKAASILKHRSYPTLYLDLLCKKAYTFYEKGDYEAADLLYIGALESPLLQKDIAKKADVLNKAGANLQNLSTLKRAMLYYNEAIELYTQLNDEKGKAVVYLNMANIFVLTGNFDQSDLFFDKSAKIFLQNNDLEKYMVVIGNKGIIKWRLGKMEEAKQLFLHSIQQNMTEVKRVDHFILVIFNLGLIYSELKQWDSCFYYLNKGKRMADSLNMSERFEGSYLYDVGYCYAKKGEVKKAIGYYKQALKLKTGIAEYKSLYDNISELYVQLKQYDTALIFKDKSLRIVDSIYKSELKEHIDFENKRIELLEKDYQNQIYTAEQDRKVIDLRKRNYLLLSVLIILIVLVLLLLLYFKQYKLRQRKEQLQSELDFLKAQLNPHFLFNSINNIYVLLDEDKDKALEILLKFSDLMRYQLYECNVNTILLSKETAFLENYIEFEKLRYGNKVKVHSNIQDFQGGELTISPLLLQPFIENAFKHSPKNKHIQSQIFIDISCHLNTLTFEVKSTLVEHGISTLPGGVGLENVKKRLKLLYPGKHSLKISTSDGFYLTYLKLKLTND